MNSNNDMGFKQDSVVSNGLRSLQSWKYKERMDTCYVNFQCLYNHYDDLNY